MEMFSSFKRILSVNACLAGFFGIPGNWWPRRSDVFSTRVLSAFARYPKAWQRMDEATARGWFDGVEEIQERLHSLQSRRQEAVARTMLYGRLSAFLCGMSVLAVALAIVASGGTEIAAVAVLVSSSAAYVGFALAARGFIARTLIVIDEKLAVAERELPERLWEDVKAANEVREKDEGLARTEG